MFSPASAPWRCRQGAVQRSQGNQQSDFRKTNAVRMYVRPLEKTQNGRKIQFGLKKERLAIRSQSCL
jgi:hypothetical protein